MKRGGRILVLLGLVLALIAGGGVYFVLANAAPEQKPIETTKVVVASQAITSRTVIQQDQLALADWPVALPTPNGAYGESAMVAGQYALQEIYPGQTIINKMVKSKEDVKSDGGLAALIVEPGYVAIPMPVTSSSNVAQAVVVGDRVDILATFTAPPSATQNQNPGPPQITTHRLLADVLILQVGPWSGQCGKAECNSAIVTFQLKEQDALVLKYSIEQSGGLTLVLRHANDHQLDSLEPVTLEYINKRFGFKFPTAGQ